MSARPVDFVAVPRNATVTDLLPVSPRASTFIAERRNSGFTRRGVKDMLARGWNVVSQDEYRATRGTA